MSILSIQSHVCYGHVGNAAAVFPLQRLGFEVWPVHSLQFSNHPGYGDWSGEVFAAKQVEGLLKAIERRGVFAGCQAVLSGYLGTAELGAAVLDSVKAVKAANPEAIFLCDPVMGDADDGIYVDPGIPEFMRKDALKSADVITPNLFELGLLIEREVPDVSAAVSAARDLLNDDDNQLKAVIVSSLPVSPAPNCERIGVLAVTSTNAHLAVTPKLHFDPPVKGTGDTFTALFLAGFLRNRGDAAKALHDAAASLYAVIKETHRQQAGELCLIAAQDEIAAPSLNQIEIAAFPD